MPKDTKYFLNPSFENHFLGRDAIMQINQAFLKISRRLDRIERVGTKAPFSVKGLTAEGRQGAFHVTWQKVVGADGYVLVMATDAAAQLITHRFDLNGQETISHDIPWANVASTRYFQIWAIRAGKQSDPSQIKSAISVGFGAGETAPTAPVQSSRSPEFEPSGLGKVEIA